MRKPTDGQLAIGGLIAFAFWLFVALPLYYGYSNSNNSPAQQCSKQEDNNYGFWEKTRCDPVAYFTLWLVGFTGVLGGSTIGLWIVTWAGGKRQSRDMQASIAIAERSLSELEAPFISIKIVDTGITRSYRDVGHDFTTLSFSVANYGRTPARLVELTDYLALRGANDGLPPEVNPQAATRNTMPYGVISPPNAESQPFTQNLFAFMMNALAADPLPLKTQNLFFYGFVRYSTIFGDVFRLGFCFMFDRYSERWLLQGGETHNYCRKE